MKGPVIEKDGSSEPPDTEAVFKSPKANGLFKEPNVVGVIHSFAGDFDLEIFSAPSVGRTNPVCKPGNQFPERAPPEHIWQVLV